MLQCCSRAVLRGELPFPEAGSFDTLVPYNHPYLIVQEAKRQWTRLQRSPQIPTLAQ